MAGSCLHGEVRSLFSTALNIVGLELEGDWDQVPSSCGFAISAKNSSPVQ